MTKLEPIEIDPKTFLREHHTLPSLPEVLTRIQSAIHDPNVNIKKIAEFVSGDPALVGQVLKVVNSAYYGMPRQVSDVLTAIAFLGLNEVYRMTLSLSVVNTLAIEEKSELDKFWFHSFFTALSTKYLAKNYDPQLSYEDLWSAAILHDIGKLVYLKFFPDHYKALTNFKREKGCLFSEAEENLAMVPSAFLGKLLCDHWRLPDIIRNACEFHTLQDLIDVEHDNFSESSQRMICLGNIVAVLSTEELSEDTKRKIADSTTTYLDISSEKEFLSMMGDIYELRIEVDKFVGQL